MTNIENYKSIAHRKGIKKVPIEFEMCPSLRKKFTAFQEETGFSSGVLMNCLTRLLLNGYIKEVWKNNYIRKSDISEAK